MIKYALTANTSETWAGNEGNAALNIYNDFTAFPNPGSTGNVYIDESTGDIYVWNSTTNQYDKLDIGGGNSGKIWYLPNPVGPNATYAVRDQLDGPSGTANRLREWGPGTDDVTPPAIGDLMIAQGLSNTFGLFQITKDGQWTYLSAGTGGWVAGVDYAANCIASSSSGGNSVLNVYNDYTSFPTTGSPGTVYIDESTGDTYIWNDTTNQYDKLPGGFTTQTTRSVDATATDGQFDMLADDAYVEAHMSGEPSSGVWKVGYPVIDGVKFLNLKHEGSTEIAINVSGLGLAPVKPGPNSYILYRQGTTIGRIVRIGDTGVTTYPTPGDFPSTGSSGAIYIDESTGDVYLWDSTNNTYVKLELGAGFTKQLVKKHTVAGQGETITELADHALVWLNPAADGRTESGPIFTIPDITDGAAVRYLQFIVDSSVQNWLEFVDSQGHEIWAAPSSGSPLSDGVQIFQITYDKDGKPIVMTPIGGMFDDTVHKSTNAGSGTGGKLAIFKNDGGIEPSSYEPDDFIFRQTSAPQDIDTSLAMEPGNQILAQQSDGNDHPILGYTEIATGWHTNEIGNEDTPLTLKGSYDAMDMYGEGRPLYHYTDGTGAHKEDHVALVTADLQPIKDRVAALAGGGLLRGDYPTFADLPTTVPSGETWNPNDWVVVAADETHGGESTRYSITQVTPTLAYQHMFTYNTNIGPQGNAGISFATSYTNFPTTGNPDILYVDKTTGDFYLWDGSGYTKKTDFGNYVPITSSKGTIDNNNTSGMLRVIATANTPIQIRSGDDAALYLQSGPRAELAIRSSAGTAGSGTGDLNLTSGDAINLLANGDIVLRALPTGVVGAYADVQVERYVGGTVTPVWANRGDNSVLVKEDIPNITTGFVPIDSAVGHIYNDTAHNGVRIESESGRSIIINSGSNVVLNASSGTCGIVSNGLLSISGQGQMNVTANTSLNLTSVTSNVVMNPGPNMDAIINNRTTTWANRTDQSVLVKGDIPNFGGGGSGSYVPIDTTGGHVNNTAANGLSLCTWSENKAINIESGLDLNLVSKQQAWLESLSTFDVYGQTSATLAGGAAGSSVYVDDNMVMLTAGSSTSDLTAAHQMTFANRGTTSILTKGDIKDIPPYYEINISVPTSIPITGNVTYPMSTSSQINDMYRGNVVPEKGKLIVWHQGTLRALHQITDVQMSGSRNLVTRYIGCLSSPVTIADRSITVNFKNSMYISNGVGQVASHLKYPDIGVYECAYFVSGNLNQALTAGNVYDVVQLQWAPVGGTPGSVMLYPSTCLAGASSMFARTIQTANNYIDIRVNTLAGTVPSGTEISISGMLKFKVAD